MLVIFNEEKNVEKIYKISVQKKNRYKKLRTQV